MNIPAFPNDSNYTIDSSREHKAKQKRKQGMTLRDYFAAKAMQAGIGRWGGGGTMWDEAGNTHSVLARESYQIADAMLKEREK